MRNRFLDSRTARDIDLQVGKVLRGLGNPEPPIELDDVFELLKLDRQYYSTQDDSALREFFSKAVIAGKQIARRPMLLLDAVKKWDLKALYVPDRKRVLIDQSQPRLKWRWNEAHEAIHSLTEWHQTLLHGDNTFSLSPDCHEQLEAEANYGAGRLLFLQDQFLEFSRSSLPTFSLVQSASKRFGNTITSSLWRLVEALDIPALGIVSQHPHYTNGDFDSADPCQYFIRSRLFEEQYAGLTEREAFKIVRSYCSWRKRGPLGTEEIIICNDRGEEHVFLFEAFHNGHQLLSLITYLRSNPVTVAT
ncbi:MAG: hypothetical protein WA857_13070 [Candidatus Acidiferrum sp.]